MSPRRIVVGPGHTSMLLAAMLLVCVQPLALAEPVANAAPPQFTDTAEEHRFHALVSELRCVMCQNQSLADSNALIAHELRREVLELMRQGRSDAEVKQFLVARYGEFVLYQPRMTGKTWLLWFGPAMLLIAGAVVVTRVVRKRGTRDVVAADDTQEW